MGNSSYRNLDPTGFEKIKTYELASRPSKVTTGEFGGRISKGGSVGDFLESLPDILGARSLRELAAAIVMAKRSEKPIIWGIGGHVIKTGLSTVLIGLMEEGYVTAIACNGSVLVHDCEIAMVGFTSEDVDETLGEGDFGAARETGEMLNSAAARSEESEIGLGEAVCATLSESSPGYKEYSLLCKAYESQIPVTSHITVGADIGHFHPGSDGGALGSGSHYDFRLFTTLVRNMNGGGVYINCGSAVTMPEIFLKAITVNRNLGHEVRGITTANLDFIQHYRPLTNVVKRPNANGAGKGYAITGHHEIMIPLLAAQIYWAEQKD